MLGAAEQLGTERGGGRKPELGAVAEKSSVSEQVVLLLDTGMELWDPSLRLGECEMLTGTLPCQGTAVIHSCILSIPAWSRGSLLTYLPHPALPQSC